MVAREEDWQSGEELLALALQAPMVTVGGREPQLKAEPVLTPERDPIGGRRIELRRGANRVVTPPAEARGGCPLQLRQSSSHVAELPAFPPPICRDSRTERVSYVFYLSVFSL